MKAKAARSRHRKAMAGVQAKKAAVKRTTKASPKKSKMRLQLKQATKRAVENKIDARKGPDPHIKGTLLNPPASEMRREQRFKQEEKKARTRPQFPH